MDLIPADKIVNFINEICEKHNIDNEIQELIVTQVSKLKEIYGENIPKVDILNIISKQIALSKTGYKVQPVGIEEFLISPDYLDLGYNIRPAIKDFLVDLHENHPECYEVVIGGATGLGKTYAVNASIAYDIYKLSCLYSPQVQYLLSPGSEIVISYQSVSEPKALRNFNEFVGLIENSPYFMEYFPPVRRKKELIFPNNIVVKVFTATKTSAISENILDAFIDEANFMKFVKKTRRLEHTDVYDQATELYLAIKDRIENRFKDFGTNRMPGKIYLVSSANYEDDFISKKEEEAKKNKHIYVFHKALWEVKPMNLSGKKFYVQLPTDTDPGKILEEKPKIMGPSILEVPIEFKESFERNLYDSIRNIAGIPIARTIKFIPAEMIEYGNFYYDKLYGSRKFFKKEFIYSTEVRNIEKYLDIPFMRVLNYFYKFGMHIDCSVSSDSFGVAIGCVPGIRRVGERKVYFPSKGDFKDIYDVELPIFVFPGLLAIKPKPGHDIIQDDVIYMILTIKKYLTNLRWVSADRGFSTSIIQSLRRHGLYTFYQSVDRSPYPYLEFRNAGKSKRVWFPKNSIVEDELKYLIQDNVSGKVDHDPLHSKDVCDCMASVCYTLGKRHILWTKEKPKKLTTLQIYLRKENLEDVSPPLKRPSPKRISLKRPSITKGGNDGNS